MERHTGVGAHERSRGTAGGVWTVEKHFSWQKAPDVPTEAQMADFTSPLAKKGEVICGFKLVPLNTNSPGPAEVIKDDDIIDEALAYLRTNTMHRKWALDEPSEKTLVYVTRFIGSCFRVLEACPTPSEGRLALQKLALEPVALPGDKAFPLEGIFEAPETRGAADLLRAWLAQARAEAGLRLLTLFYTPAGKQSPYWLSVAHTSRKFFVVFETYRQPVEEEAAYKRNLTSSRSLEYRMPEVQQ